MSPGTRPAAGIARRDAVPDDRRQGGGHLLERLHRLFGAVFLGEPEHGVEHHDHDDGDGVRRFAEHAGEHGRSHQHDDHEVLELVEEHREHRALAPLDQFVRAMSAKAPDDLSGIEPVGAAAECNQRLIGAQRVPRIADLHLLGFQFSARHPQTSCPLTFSG